MQSENEDKNLQNDAVCNKDNTSTPSQTSTSETTLHTVKKDNFTNNNNENSYQANKQQQEHTHASKLQCLGTRIDEDVLKAFRVHVINKYGRLNKVFSWEVQAALSHYLECNRKQRQTTSHTLSDDNDKRRTDVQAKLNEIAHEFLRTKSYPDFSAETIKKIIKDIIGVERDRRTFMKYLAIIRKQSKEKPSGFSMYSIFDVSGFCQRTLGLSLNTVEKEKVQDEDDDLE